MEEKSTLAGEGEGRSLQAYYRTRKGRRCRPLQTGDGVGVGVEKVKNKGELRKKNKGKEMERNL